MSPCGPRRNDGKIEIEVADDGPGLPPKALQNLFVPFQGSTRSGGTGLGLAIARELMRVQGGDLRLAATTRKGATFVLELPDRRCGVGQPFGILPTDSPVAYFARRLKLREKPEWI